MSGLDQSYLRQSRGAHADIISFCSFVRVERNDCIGRVEETYKDKGLSKADFFTNAADCKFEIGMVATQKLIL